MKSEQINELAAALAKAQAEIKAVVKDAKNPFFKSSYATLNSVWDAIRQPLAKNGLSVTQLTSETEAGTLLETYLLHSSGQWLQSEMLLRPNKNDVQGFGSALTYTRRYCLAAIVGAAPDDDDDGQAATEGDSKPTAAPAAKKAAPAKPNGNGQKSTLTLGQQKLFDAVQAATNNYYRHPAHMVKVIGKWPNFSSQDDIDSAISVAVDHASEQQEVAEVA